MEVKALTVGEMRENCYLFYDPMSRECAIIDPGDEADFISEEILRLQLKPQFILLTHGHFDHCLACLELKLNFNIPIYLDSKDNFLYQKSFSSANHFGHSNALKQPPTLSFPKSLTLGSNTLSILPTPGHTPGSVSFHANSHLFVGDTLFSDGVGATNYRYSSAPDLQKSLKKIRQLPSGTEVHPGHGESFLL